jgi:hypothetical protein
MDTKILNWLLTGDVSVQYQVHRDLLGQNRPDLQTRIAQEGWGARFLAARRPEGYWGKGFYQPKWTSSHYSLLDLKTLQISPEIDLIRESVAWIADHQKASDGGINPAKTIKESDVCINGMFLNYACYFGIGQEQLLSIVDFILAEHMPDGGFNCRSNRGGARHSSLHSTISLLEGIHEYNRSDYAYRLDELQRAAEAAREFILQHHLFRSDRTGDVIHQGFLMLSFPGRWRYDILRALDYFQDADIPWDTRMQDALQVLVNKRRADGRWPLQARHAGKTHFEMEKPGQPSRWNTLRALRVLRRYDPDEVR